MFYCSLDITLVSILDQSSFGQPLVHVTAMSQHTLSPPSPFPTHYTLSRVVYNSDQDIDLPMVHFVQSPPSSLVHHTLDGHYTFGRSSHIWTVLTHLDGHYTMLMTSWLSYCIANMFIFPSTRLITPTRSDHVDIADS